MLRHAVYASAKDAASASHYYAYALLRRAVVAAADFAATLCHARASYADILLLIRRYMPMPPLMPLRMLRATCAMFDARHMPQILPLMID